MTAEDVRQIVEYAKREVVGFASMMAAIATTVLAQAGTLGLRPTVTHWISVIGVVAGLVAAYTIRPYVTRAAIDPVVGFERRAAIRPSPDPPTKEG